MDDSQERITNSTISSPSSSPQINSHQHLNTSDNLLAHYDDEDDDVTFLDEYSDYLGPKLKLPGHIKDITKTSLSNQSSIDSVLATSPKIRVENLTPQNAKHIGVINALIELIEKAVTPILLLLLLCRWGLIHLKGIWIGLPAAALLTVPIAMAAFLMFKDEMYTCKGYINSGTKIIVITSLTLATITAAYTGSLYYLDAYNIPWHLLLCSLFSFILFSSSIAYTQYILISYKSSIQGDWEVKESNAQNEYYKIFDSLPKSQKIRSIAMFWSAFVEALSIGFLTYSFFMKTTWLTFNPLVNATLWSIITCIALSRFIKVINSDAAEAEKINNRQIGLSKTSSSNSNASWSHQIDYYKDYKINKYTTSEYLDIFFANVIQLFSYQITPVIENTANWIALFVLYYDIQQIHKIGNLAQSDIKIIFYIYLAITLLALSGEYFFQFAADRKWTRINTMHKYATPKNSLQWRASPSFYGRILLSITSIPAWFYICMTKMFKCENKINVSKKITYTSAMLSKNLGHSAILGVILLELYYLIAGRYPNLTISLILLSTALILGALKGYGQCRARKLETNNLSEIILDQLSFPSNDTDESKHHGYQDSTMTQIPSMISRQKKIYEGLNLAPSQFLTLNKIEAFFLLLWLSCASLFALNYFNWIHLSHMIYMSSMISSITLLALLCLYQLKSMCQRSTATIPQQLSHEYPSLREEEEQKKTFGRETFTQTLSKHGSSSHSPLSTKRHQTIYHFHSSQASPLPNIKTDANESSQSPK